jgi:hypothetical protein
MLPVNASVQFTNLAQAYLKSEEQSIQNGLVPAKTLTTDDIDQLSKKVGVSYARIDLGPAVDRMIGSPELVAYVAQPVTPTYKPILDTNDIYGTSVIFEETASPLHPTPTYQQVVPEPAASPE